MPLAVLMLPCPSFSVPFQTAEAVRCMGFSCGLLDFDSVLRNSCLPSALAAWVPGTVLHSRRAEIQPRREWEAISFELCERLRFQCTSDGGGGASRVLSE